MDGWPAEKLRAGDVYWWSGRRVRVLAVVRRWITPTHSGVSILVEPANGEQWEPRRLAYFDGEQVEISQ